MLSPNIQVYIKGRGVCMQRIKSKCGVSNRWGKGKFGSKSTPKGLGLGVHRQLQLYVWVSAEDE